MGNRLADDGGAVVIIRVWMSEMEYLFAVAIVALVLLTIVVPAIWSRDPVRRADAREILRMVLSALGRRKV
jgi:hypothetical protein